MENLEVIVLVLLAATVALAVLSDMVRVPYPIVLVVGGSALGFVPGLPDVELEPELVLLIFLPPLLYGAAFFSSLRDLRRNASTIGGLAIVLVIVTVASVAVLAHEVIGLAWETAFVLGAVVGPTDAVAPAAILRRLGAPRRIVTVVEGENLTNDWTALVLYKFAVAAAVTGSFELAEAGPKFIWTGIGGVAAGLIVGRVIREIRFRLDDPPLEVTISVFSGYFAYLPAEAIGVSGVIAAVTTGIYMGWYTPILTTPETRIQGQSLWQILTFVLNALLFLLVGLQLPAILDDLAGYGTGELVGWALLVSAAVILVRVVFVFAFSLVAVRDSTWRSTTVIAWSGMRGAVSLAAALAIPTDVDGRELLIFLALAAIFATLVLQGLTLGPLIDALELEDDGSERAEETLARMRSAEAATVRLQELAGEEWVNDDTVGRLQGLYAYRQRRFGARLDGEGDHALERRSDAYRKLMRQLIQAEREALIGMRNSGEISDEVRRVVERDLDLEESRLG